MKTEMKVKLIAHTPEPEKVVAAAAKLCYSHSGANELMDGLTDVATEKFIGRLTAMGHGSPTEHASFTFAIEGVSRALTHQLVRHRLASYSQKSQRYVTEHQFDFVIPYEIEESEATKELFEDAMADIQERYNELVGELSNKHYKRFVEEGMTKKEAMAKAEKKAIEDARYVLPNACETKIVVTMNARELIHFFNQRCCNRAQWEIRELATQMLKSVKEIAPTLFKNAGPKCVIGPCPEGEMCCGEIQSVREKFKSM